MLLNREIFKEVIFSICKWRENQQISYPWRKTNDPFFILTAEFMLQRTTPKRVIPFYNDFVMCFKKPDSVLSNDSVINNYFESLGLQKRKHLFLKTCEIITSKYNGFVPDDYETLVLLPGIGDYSAAAILLFAFKKDVIPVDVNVERFLKRSKAFPLKKGRKKSYICLSQEYPNLVDVPTWNKLGVSILDLSLMICRKKPSCQECPILERCKFHFEDII